MREIDLLVVHCSDTPSSMDIGVEEIRQWHKNRGWRDVGYHFVIRRNGAVEVGRPVEEMGAHVRGHNTNSIGICLVGGKPTFNFTWEQFFALRGLIDRLRREYPEAALLGHRDLDDNKECPTFDVRSLFR